MNHELDVDVIFGDTDPHTNMQTVTLKVPAHINPDAARKLFLNALWGQVDDNLFSTNEKESK